MHFDVIVIGAGAAGMMCASECGLRGRKVLLIDHAERIGERIRISGGGHCNFTNRDVGAGNYLSRNPHFCRSAIARFTSLDFVGRLERKGIPYHERKHGQLFCDGSAQAITNMLRDDCNAVGVMWAQPCKVQAVKRLNEGNADRFEVLTDQHVFKTTSLVIATGGLAVPKMGATPFGYRLAEQFGIPVVPPMAALVPLALQPELLTSFKPLSGISVEAGVVAPPESPEFRESILLTHRGLSGPAILQASSYWQYQQAISGTHGPVRIDLLPGKEAVSWLVRNQRTHTLLSAVLTEQLPRRFAQVWSSLYGEDRPMDTFSIRELQSVGDRLNAWTLFPSGTLGYAKAEVTLGGIDTHALSSKTMEAREIPGLFFIGEVVDVTGWLGGYNFQWAWSSGWVAGQFA